MPNAFLEGLWTLKSSQEGFDRIAATREHSHAMVASRGPLAAPGHQTRHMKLSSRLKSSPATEGSVCARREPDGSDMTIALHMTDRPAAKRLRDDPRSIRS